MLIINIIIFEIKDYVKQKIILLICSTIQFKNILFIIKKRSNSIYSKAKSNTYFNARIKKNTFLFCFLNQIKQVRNTKGNTVILLLLIRKRPNTAQKNEAFSS